MGGMVLGIDEKFFLGKKNGSTLIILFKNLGVPPNHQIFRLRPPGGASCPRTASAEKIW